MDMSCSVTYLSCSTSGKVETFLKPHEGGFSASYLVVLVKYYDTYNAFIPDVLGCMATSFDLQHVRELIAQGLEYHLDGILEDKLPVPEAKTVQYNDFEPEEHLVEFGVLQVKGTIEFPAPCLK